MTNRLVAVLAILSASLLAFGCADDSTDDGNGPIDCSFTACGGDLVGTWNVAGSCAATGTEGIAACSDAVFSGNPEMTGTITFRADGTASRSTHNTGTSHMVLGEACLTALSGGAATPEQYCQAAGAAAAIPGSGVTGSCSFAGGKCTCDLTFDQTVTGDADYTTSGTTVTVNGLTSPYCVSGDQLKVELEGTLTVLDRDGGSGGSGGTGGTGGTGGNGGTGGTGDVCDFEACGGAYQGTWTAADTCSVTVQDFSDDEACQDLPVQITVDVSGTLVYTADTETSTLVFDQYDIEFAFPPDCADAIGAGQTQPMGGEEFCAAYDQALGNAGVGGCSWSSSNGCTCTMDQAGDYGWEDVPFEIRGNAMVFEGQNGEIVQDFCVDGNVQQQDWGDFILVLNK